MTLHLSLLLLRKMTFKLFLEIVKSIHDQVCRFEKAMQKVAEVIVEYIQEEEGEIMTAQETNNKHKQRRSIFCLMKYECRKCGHLEIIWNSRDGVTPFIILCRKCGGETNHIDWSNDVYMPDYKPKEGERIFIDLLYERFLELQKRKIERYWNDTEYPMCEMFDNKEEALKQLTEDFRKGEPSIKTITKEE